MNQFERIALLLNFPGFEDGETPINGADLVEWIGEILKEDSCCLGGTKKGEKV